MTSWRGFPRAWPTCNAPVTFRGEMTMTNFPSLTFEEARSLPPAIPSRVDGYRIVCLELGITKGLKSFLLTDGRILDIFRGGSSSGVGAFAFFTLPFPAAGRAWAACLVFFSKNLTAFSAYFRSFSPIYRRSSLGLGFFQGR